MSNKDRVSLLVLFEWYGSYLWNIFWFEQKLKLLTAQKLHSFNMNFSPFFPFDSNWLHSTPYLTCLFLPGMSTPLIIKPPGQGGSCQYQIILGTKSQVYWPKDRISVKLEILSRPQLCSSFRPRKAEQPPPTTHPCKTRQCTTMADIRIRHTDQLPLTWVPTNQ